MEMVEWFEFQVPGKVVCAEDSMASIGTQVDEVGGSKALIVTDQGVEKAGLVQKVIDGMESGLAEAIGIFDEVPQDSEIKIVQKCCEKALELGADALISVGGGSVIDTAKATAIVLCEGGELLDHQSAVYVASKPMIPHLAVPTTAGTGSESTFSCIIADHEDKIKYIFQGPVLTPTVAMLDPLMIVTLPPLLTASTGMDALTHAIEALHSEMHQPITDNLALGAIKIISQYLERATRNGDDIEARKHMLIAANMGGIVIANAFVGIVHAMAHSVGSRFNVPHGVANAILLPHGMEFNLQYEQVPGEYRLVAEALGLDVSGDEDTVASKKAIEYIKELTVRLGLPQALSEVGVPEDELEAVSEDSVLDGSMLNNPGEPEVEEVLELFQKTY